MSRYPNRDTSRLVLIGTSTFEHPDKLANLPGVRGNLSDLERVLTDPVRGVFDPAHTDVVDTPDSPGGLMDRLYAAAEQAEDVLMVYYAGHGTLDRHGELHLAVRQTDPALHKVRVTAVPFTAIRQVIEDSPARIRVVVLDCCFSGKAAGAMSADT